MAFLLTMASGRAGTLTRPVGPQSDAQLVVQTDAPVVAIADMLPYLHHLLLLRDRMRIQLSVPGGLFSHLHTGA